MCFSPKIKTPKVNTNSIQAPAPAPLTEEVKGVEFGGSDETKSEKDSDNTSSKSGRSSLKVKLNETAKSSGGKKASIRSRFSK